MNFLFRNIICSRFLFLPAFALLFLSTGSARDNIDSLKVILVLTKEDSSRIKILNELCRLNFNEPDSAFNYCAKSLVLANKIGYERGKAVCLRQIGTVYYMKKNLDEAISYYYQSLKTFENIKDETEVINTIKFISTVHMDNKEFEKARDILFKAIGMLRRTNDEVLIADFYLRLAYLYKDQSNYNKTLEYFSKSLEIKEKLGKKDEVAALLNSIGLVYRLQGDYGNALKYYLKSLQVNREMEDQKGTLHALNNIGIVYWYLEQYDEALKYYQECLQISKEMNDPEGIAKRINNIAGVYQKQGKIDEALEYYFEALSYMEELGNQRYVANILTNIGSIYVEKKSYELALDYSLRSLEMNEKFGSKENMASGLRDLGKIHYHLGKYDKALEYLNRCLAVANEAKAKEKIKDAYYYLAIAYEKQEMYQQAYEYYKLFDNMQDSLMNFDVSKQVNELLTRHEMEKKEQEIELFRKDMEIRNLTVSRQRGIMISSGAVLVLVIILSFSIYSGKKRSDNLLLNILPAATAKELKKHGSAKAKRFELVTVFFSDFVGFTKAAEQLTADELVARIDRHFQVFDDIMKRHNIEKIKTVGDAYMAAGGLPIPNTTNPLDVVAASVEIMEYINTQKDEFFQIRIGIHTGAVIAGVVGKHKFQYDIWGDAVNIAARMEQHSEPGKINISETTYGLASQRMTDSHSMTFTYRGEIEAKNKGKLKMYFVES